MRNKIIIEHNFDTTPYTTVTNGKRSITVWPGPNYLMDLQKAKVKLTTNIYCDKLLEAIKPLYELAKNKNENLIFFESLVEMSELAQQAVDLGYENIARGNYEKHRN